MAYITNANFRRITRELNVPKDKNFEFDDIIIWEAPNGKNIDKNNPSIFGWWEVNDLLAFCAIPRTRKEITEYLGISTVFYAMQHYVQPLLASGDLIMTMGAGDIVKCGEELVDLLNK